MNALTLLAAVLLLPAPALAHVGDGLHHGLMAGFLHPFSGVDHLLAMVMVGLWAGLLGGTARLALPGAFLGAMALGGVLGMAGLALPGVEAGILASVVVLGALAALTSTYRSWGVASTTTLNDRTVTIGAFGWVHVRPLLPESK